MANATEVWQEHREALLRFVLSRGIESHDAEDIVHDVLLKVIAPGGGPSEPSKLRAWLFQVVRNAIIDHHRRKRPYEEVAEDIQEVRVLDDRPDLLLSCLEPFLARLEKADAEVLRMADHDGVPQGQIAEQLGLGLSATKSRIQRARAKVFKMYQECCKVELDKHGRLVEYTERSCEMSKEDNHSGNGCNSCSS